MSETALNEQPDTSSLFLDGEAPRLASGPIKAPAPTGAMAPMADAPKIDLPPDAPKLPTVSPVLSSAEAPIAPSAGLAPPSGAPTSEAPDAPAESADAEPAHPMAHLMPQKSGQSEASKRAAEIRAAQKAKAKKVKIGVAAGFLVFAVAVGPPLFSWLSNAVNEAGDTSTEEPAD